MSTRGFWKISTSIVGSAIIAALAFPIAGETRAAGTVTCTLPGSVLMGRRAGVLAGVDTVGVDRELPSMETPEGRLWWGRQLIAPVSAPHWIVTRQSTDTSVLIAIADAKGGNIVLQREFAKRIELAASSVSPSARYTVYVQGNNVASEVSIFDAAEREVRDVRLPHQMDLAPYAIGFAYSPQESCVAISLERVGQVEMEIWLVDLATGAARVIDTRGMTVQRWVMELR